MAGRLEVRFGKDKGTLDPLDLGILTSTKESLEGGGLRGKGESKREYHQRPRRHRK